MGAKSRDENAEIPLIVAEYAANSEKTILRNSILNGKKSPVRRIVRTGDIFRSFYRSRRGISVTAQSWGFIVGKYVLTSLPLIKPLCPSLFSVFTLFICSCDNLREVSFNKGSL